jgi:hypothetical protein
VFRWRRVGSGLQTVLREPSILAHGLVGQVACRFSEHGEVGWAFHPPHGEGERKSNEGRATLARQHHAQFWNICCTYPNTVEAISDIYFSQFWRAKSRVGMSYTSQDALQRAPELHRLRRSQTNGLIVDLRKGVVDDEPRSAVTLGDHTEWREAEVVQRKYSCQGQDNPIPLLTELEELFTHKFNVSISGLMRTPRSCLIHLGPGPGRRGGRYRRAPPTEVVQGTCSLVWDRPHGLGHVGVSSRCRHHSFLAECLELNRRVTSPLTQCCLRGSHQALSLTAPMREVRTCRSHCCCRCHRGWTLGG